MPTPPVPERYPLDGPVPGPYGRLRDVYDPARRREPRTIEAYRPRLVMPYLSTEWLREHTRTDITCRVCHATPRERLDQVGPCVEYECSRCLLGLTTESQARVEERRADRGREQARVRQQNRRAARRPQEPRSVSGQGNGQTPPSERDRVSRNPASIRPSSDPISSSPRRGRPRKHEDDKARKRAWWRRRTEVA